MKAPSHAKESLFSLLKQATDELHDVQFALGNVAMELARDDSQKDEFCYALGFLSQLRATLLEVESNVAQLETAPPAPMVDVAPPPTADGPIPAAKSKSAPRRAPRSLGSRIAPERVTELHSFIVREGSVTLAAAMKAMSISKYTVEAGLRILVERGLAKKTKDDETGTTRWVTTAPDCFRPTRISPDVTPPPPVRARVEAVEPVAAE